MHGNLFWRIKLVTVIFLLFGLTAEAREVKKIFGPFSKESYQEMNNTLTEMEEIFKRMVKMNLKSVSAKNFFGHNIKSK
jgi:hypothetical protein